MTNGLRNANQYGFIFLFSILFFDVFSLSKDIDVYQSRQASDSFGHFFTQSLAQTTVLYNQ